MSATVRERPGETGAALITVLMIVVVVGMMANLSLLRSTTLARDTLRDRHQLQAHYAVEAGLAKACQMLGADAKWTGGHYQIGNCEVEVTAHQQRDSWQIEARARLTRGNQVVAAHRQSRVWPPLARPPR